MNHNKYVVAIDGGGTKTEGVIVGADGAIVSYCRGFATNPNDMGEVEAGRRLSVLIEKLLKKLPANGVIAAAFAGVSGAIGHENALEAEVSKVLPNAAVKVGTDIYNLFGLADDAEAALICGTGSVCFVKPKKAPDQLHRIGGWGYLLDTSGGGYSIGRDGLEAALRAVDGRGDATLLRRYAAEYLGDAPERSIGKIYEGGKTLIAGFTRCVFDAEAEGDRVAGEVIDRCASGLADHLVCASDFIGEGNPFTCILSGGLISDPAMFSRFQRFVADEEVPVTFIKPELPQLAGAAKTAFRMVNLGVADGFDLKFAADYAVAKSEST